MERDRELATAESDPIAAISDFRLAVDRGAPLVTPYLYLAQDALHNQRYAGCQELCERGIRLADRAQDQAELRELLAITRLALNEAVDEAVEQ